MLVNEGPELGCCGRGESREKKQNYKGTNFGKD